MRLLGQTVKNNAELLFERIARDIASAFQLLANGN